MRFQLLESSQMYSHMIFDECLKHSSYTRVGSSFSHFFHSTSIVFMDKYLILSLV